MSTAAVSALENTLHTTYEWLNDLKEELQRDDSRHAYRAMRAVLLALRDRLTVEEAADFGSQLPLLIRGIFYEGWNPSKVPVRIRNRDEFLAQVSKNLVDRKDGDPADVTRAVFKIISERVTRGEVQDICGTLPQGIRDLWPVDFVL